MTSSVFMFKTEWGTYLLETPSGLLYRVPDDGSDEVLLGEVVSIDCEGRNGFSTEDIGKKVQITLHRDCHTSLYPMTLYAAEAMCCM